MNRQDLEGGKVTAEEYYRALAKDLYIEFTKTEAQRATHYKETDWRRLASDYRDKSHLFLTFRNYGSVWNTVDHVAALKQAAKDGLERGAHGENKNG